MRVAAFAALSRLAGRLDQAEAEKIVDLMAQVSLGWAAIGAAVAAGQRGELFAGRELRQEAVGGTDGTGGTDLWEH